MASTTCRLLFRTAFVTSLTLLVTLKSEESYAKSDIDLEYIRTVMQRVLQDDEEIQELTKEVAAPTVRELRIVQFLQGEEQTVVIEGGREQGVVDGAILNSFRPRPDIVNTSRDLWVNTGKLKAFHVDANFTLARVIQNGSNLAKAFYPNHPFPMAGDFLSETRFQIAKNPILAPSKTILYTDLFEDPKANPISFELTEAGKQKLIDAAKIYTDMHLPILMIEGYTDANGPQDLNQVESYQRALTVRQFLIDQLGFAPSRVIAIGYGESQITDKSQVAGYRIANRRILLKVNGNASIGH